MAVGTATTAVAMGVALPMVIAIITAVHPAEAAARITAGAIPTAVPAGDLRGIITMIIGEEEAGVDQDGATIGGGADRLPGDSGGMTDSAGEEAITIIAGEEEGGMNIGTTDLRLPVAVVAGPIWAVEGGETASVGIFTGGRDLHRHEGGPKGVVVLAIEAGEVEDNAAGPPRRPAATTVATPPRIDRGLIPIQRHARHLMIRGAIRDRRAIRAPPEKDVLGAGALRGRHQGAILIRPIR